MPKALYYEVKSILLTPASRRVARIAPLTLLLALASPLGLAAQVQRLPPPSQPAVPTMIMQPLWAGPNDVGWMSAPEGVAVGEGEQNGFMSASERPTHGLTYAEEFEAPPPRVSWYNPLSWFFPKCWDTSFEVGLNSSRGNADSFNIRTGLGLTRVTPLTTWDVDITYAKNESAGRELQHNALAYSNWDWKLPVDRWSLFWKSGFEYDEFKNFDVRINTNGGFGYALLSSEGGEDLLRGRFGSGVSREFGGSDVTWHPEATFGVDMKRRLTERQKLSAVVDYFPNWTRFGDYRIVSDMGWEVQIDQADNLSLKLSVIDRYDSTPNGARPNDVDYAVLVIWSH